MRERNQRYLLCAVMIALALAGACGKKKPPVARPTPPPPPMAPDTTARPPAPPEPVRENPPIPPEPTISDDPLAGKDLDVINKNSPFQPVFFPLDSSEVDQAGQQALNANAEVLQEVRDLGDHHRGTLRRAWDRRIQSRARRTPGAGRQDLPRVARDSDGSAAHRQLRQGISLRSRTRRGRVVQESTRALRRHEQVGSGDW